MLARSFSRRSAAHSRASLMTRERPLHKQPRKQAQKPLDSMPPAEALKVELQAKYGVYAKYFEADYREVPAAQKYADKYDKHKQLIAWSYISPMNPLIAESAFVAPTATVAGNVEIWHEASIWYNVVIRGDVNLVRIGSGTNIQDNTTISEAFSPLSTTHDGSTIVGHSVTVGHSCHLRACTIEDECVVGMNSVLSEGSYMESHSILAANSLLAPGVRIKSGELWAGKPARFIRKLDAHEIANIEDAAKDYVQTADQHKEEFFLPSSLHIDAEKLGFDIGYHV